MDKLVICLLIVGGLVEQTAIAGAIAWKNPEMIFQTDAEFQTSTFTVLPLQSGPAIVFSTHVPGIRPLFLNIAERFKDGWKTKTLYDIGPTAVPMHAASAIRNGVPYVVAKLRYPQEVHIYSRQDDNWTREYRREEVGDTVYWNRMEMTTLGEQVVAAHVNYFNQRYVDIIENSSPTDGWTTTIGAVSFAHPIYNINGTLIDGRAAFLMQGGRDAWDNSDDRSYLVTRELNSWKKIEIPHSIHGALTEWQGRPAIAARANANGGPIVFDYLDAGGSWRREVVAPTGGDVDVIVHGGQPLVAYGYHYDGKQVIGIAQRSDDGKWSNHLIPNTDSESIDMLDLFEWNGRPAVTYMNIEESTLHAVFAVPEPANGMMLVFIFGILCRRGRHTVSRVELTPTAS